MCRHHVYATMSICERFQTATAATLASRRCVIALRNARRCEAPLPEW